MPRRFSALLLLAGVWVGAASADTVPLHEATIADVNAAFDAGTLTSERLVEMYLARIAAYDQAGPRLNTLITVNPHALDDAKARDEERRRSGRRSPLHGIPVLVKDNIDTADLPTTAGSVLLKDSRPPDDAFVVEQLRKAGAVIIGKANMSEFAAGPAMSSITGRIRNPHDPARTASGSSGGTGAAIAANLAMAGLGSDTGGSVRAPSAANGTAGLKTTMGLVSRDGVVPLALTFDTVGPMARHVYDVAALLSVIAGVDAADEATRAGRGKIEKDYTAGLSPDALKGARIGVARDYMGRHTDMDWATETALEVMRQAGATTVDVRLPEWLRTVNRPWFMAIMPREFAQQIGPYLATLGPQYPKSLDELIARSQTFVAPDGSGSVPNPRRWSEFNDAKKALAPERDLEADMIYAHALPLIRAAMTRLFVDAGIDALVYPTLSAPAAVWDPDINPVATTFVGPTFLANMSGFPDLVVPSGFSAGGLPITLSFLGPAFSEARLLALGYAFEQRSKAYRLPVTTPPLAGETVATSR
ncbi:MAG: amidase family protein [Rhodospirillaceae bacterium]|nr:amidase family protein [Rhodospirillaceae bacterium]